MTKAEETEPSGAAERGARVKAFIKDHYGFEPLSESSAYITYLISRSDEARLPEMLKSLEANTETLGISDLQVRARPPACCHWLLLCV